MNAPGRERESREGASEDDAPRRPMTLAEAGRKGGEKVKRERGADFYAAIGRKGGRRVAQSMGSAFYSEIGRRGGEARRRDAAEEGEDTSDNHPPVSE